MQHVVTTGAVRLSSYHYHICCYLQGSIGLAERETTFVVYSVKYNLCRLSYLHVTGKKNGFALKMLSCGFLVAHKTAMFGRC